MTAGVLGSSECQEKGAENQGAHFSFYIKTSKTFAARSQYFQVVEDVFPKKKKTKGGRAEEQPLPGEWLGMAGLPSISLSQQRKEMSVSSWDVLSSWSLL